MQKVSVKLKKKVDYSYDIYIGNKILGDWLLDYFKQNSFSIIGIITDSNVDKIYKEKITSLFPKNSRWFTFSAGEENKNINTLLQLSSSLQKENFDRKSLLVALGGGVTGDITGFLASIYMRGISFIQIPTSLLAMVDSSIGGKTGIDTEFGKNLLGTFSQPEAVVIDTEFLKTLPEIEIKNGMAEIIKHGLIFDKDYLLNLKDTDYEKIVKRSCEIKSYVVSKDEKENGLRQILNFGHTIGHGLEKLFDFSLPHGICVALGMLIESRISMERKILSIEDYNQIENILKNYGYLNYLEKIKGLDIEKLFSIMLSDKKNLKGKVRIVLLKKIGRVYNEGNIYSFPVDINEFIKVFQTLNIL
ncbi:MAG: 3-dehydroquinate synthase [Brevinematales bacterium]|nr:3-dehydroquinate synthase [Brevinematales bacterium]